MASMAVISSSSNWIVAEGLISDSISFETSLTDDDTVPKGLLLLRPPPPPPDEEDPLPCEITIFFRGKHKIRSVYLRSTARIYEIYYASDHRNTNTEYLCTVRCGAAVRELTSPIVTEEADECEENDKGAAATLEQVVRSDGSTSDEDGWIQVKVPDSPPRDNTMNLLSKSSDSPNMQTHYEATAEIADSSPCVSLTLRLLSVQTKDCVHVEEIYIYADPVDSSSLDPPTTMSEASGRSSLLAMLVPSLLELSKSRFSRMQEKGSFEEPQGPNYQHDMKPARTISMDTGKTAVPQAYSSCISPGPIQEPTEVNSEKIHLEPIKQVSEMNQIPNSCTDQHINMGYNRVEKLLDELLSRVGRVEAFCSRFEENIMKPLSSMDLRLQQVEHKLDSLVARQQSSEQLLEESDSVNKFCNTECRKAKQDSIADTVSPVDDSASSTPEFKTRPGLVIKAPDFPNEDDDCVDTDDNLYEEFVLVNNLCSAKCREAREDTIAEAVLPVDAMASSPPELEKHTGLVMKAPEGCVDTLHSSLDCPIKDKAMPIDDVIASTLKAFVSSNTVRSPNTIANLSESSQVCSVGTNGTLDSFKNVVSEDDGRGISDERGKGICAGDSSLVLDDAAASYNKSSEADTENKGWETLNAIWENCESTDLDDSLLLTSGFVNCTMPSFHFGSSSKAMNPEVSKEGEPSKHDDISDLVERNCYSMSNIVQSVSPMASFQNLSTVRPNKNSPVLVATSSGLSDGNEFTVSSVAVPCKGANESCIKNNCEVTEDNEMKVKVYLKQIRNILPRKIRWEKQEHDGGKCRCGAVDVEAYACLPCDRILKQQDCNGVKWNEHHHLQTNDGLHTQNLTISCAGLTHNCWARANDNYCEKGLSSSGFVSRWNDEYNSYSCCSSLDEHIVGNKAGSGKSDGGSIDSSRGDSTLVLVSGDSDGESTDSEYSCNSSLDDNYIKDKVEILSSDRGCTDSSHCPQQVAYSNSENVLPDLSFMNKSISHYDFATASHQSFEGNYSQVKSNAGLRQELSSCMVDKGDAYNVKITPEKNWIIEQPLKVLLGEMPDSSVHKAAVKGGEDGKDDGVTSEQLQHNPSSYRGTDSNADADSRLLLLGSALITEDELKAIANLPQFTGRLF